MITAEAVGYFTDASQADPTYEPPFPCACPVCGGVVDDSNVRTVSVAPLSGRVRSAFYRLHRACSDGLAPEASIALDEEAMRLAGCAGQHGDAA